MKGDGDKDKSGVLVVPNADKPVAARRPPVTAEVQKTDVEVPCLGHDLLG